MKLVKKRMNPKAKLLIDALVQDGLTVKDAAQKIGYKGPSARVNAHKLLKDPDVHNLYLVEIQKKIGLGAHRALGSVLKLSDNAQSEYVKLEASKDILDRAGFKPVDKSQHLIAGDFNIKIDLS
tara:strand:+ start:282 stop:653 length:372 start_codon:yes stop_codon:yes gene_type:complete